MQMLPLQLLLLQTLHHAGRLHDGMQAACTVGCFASCVLVATC
jgi:hypothetical protein